LGAFQNHNMCTKFREDPKLACGIIIEIGRHTHTQKHKHKDSDTKVSEFINCHLTSTDVLHMGKISVLISTSNLIYVIKYKTMSVKTF
jgi:hypothetical protein